MPRAAGARGRAGPDAGARALSALLVKLLGCASAAAARAFLASKACTRAQRKVLAQFAGLQAAWVDCDQAVPGNVADLADSLVSELYEPFWFFRGSLGLGGGEHARDAPRRRFSRQLATRPLRKAKSTGFWRATDEVAAHQWLPAVRDGGSGADVATGGATFDAVVHFVQAASGTGVHVGGGRVLTCAHVVEARDDDDLEEGAVPARVGRQKLAMFPSGRTFVVECAAVRETADGAEDVAVVHLGPELPLAGLPPSRGPARPAKRHRPEGAHTSERGAGTSGGPGSPQGPLLPAAAVAAEAVEHGARLFCVGNPSNVDLESLAQGSIEFTPPTWHASVGQCEGYLDPTAQKLRDELDARGRPPTRGELRALADAQPTASHTGGYLQHSCWTYWGHSGAPLFNESGNVVGLHCAWEERTGMRYGQKLQHIQAVLQEETGPHADDNAPVVSKASVDKAGPECISLVGSDDSGDDEAILPLAERLSKRLRRAEQ